MSNRVNHDQEQIAEEHTPMTIDEMLKEYPTAEVEKAIFDLNFSQYDLLYLLQIFICES